MNPLVARALVACAGIWLTGAGHALTLDRAVELALQRNPELAASAWDLVAGQARVTQANLRPNPGLAVDLENFAGRGALQGTDALEATLSLSQVIELGDKRGRRVTAARERQRMRYAHTLSTAPSVAAPFTNASAPARLIAPASRLHPEARALLVRAADKLTLSARAYHRVLRVARTIADLDDEDIVSRDHLAEALRFRPVGDDRSAAA